MHIEYNLAILRSKKISRFDSRVVLVSNLDIRLFLTSPNTRLLT